MAIDIPVLDYSTDPTAEDVEVKIKGANWWPVDEDQIDAARAVATIAINASMRRFLRDVGWKPFKSNGQSETRYFNQIDEEGRIALGEGLLEFTSLTIQGRSFTVNQNVFAEPVNAATANEPFTSLLLWSQGFGSGYYGYGGDSCYSQARELPPRSIAVTGKWGRVLLWPEDAYEAIVARAACITLSSVNQESDLASISEDEYTESYDLVGPIDQKTALGEWGKFFTQVAASWAKPRSGARTLSTAPRTARNARRYLPAL